MCPSDATHCAPVNAATTADGPLTQLCKAAGDPLRMQILRVLRHNAYGVLELCQIFSIRQSTMSHHLKLLANAGLLATRREATSIFYRRNSAHPEHSISAFLTALYRAVDELSIEPEQQHLIDAVHAERSANSRQFFDDNAERFDTNQDLIASWRDYGESVERFVDQHVAGERRCAVEIGPGYGDFLPYLSRHYERVVAVENAAPMLAACRQRTADYGLENINYLHGDSRSPALAEVRADLVSLNMVLHHNAAPAEIIADAAALLSDSGSLLITELCEHDQSWAQSACGDLWLGLAAEALEEWCGAAGLAPAASLYLAQRNGFRLQIRQFIAASDFAASR